MQEPFGVNGGKQEQPKGDSDHLWASALLLEKGI